MRYDLTTLEEAAKYALIALDSTMRSNVTVGPPINLLVYGRNELRVAHYRRFSERDPEPRDIHERWERALRKAVQKLPEVRFEEPAPGDGAGTGTGQGVKDVGPRGPA